MKKVIAGIILLFINLFASCDESDSRLTLINKSEFNLAHFETCNINDSVLNGFEFYKTNVLYKNDFQKVSRFGKYAWLQEINNSPNEILSIYLYNLDSLIKDEKKYKTMDSLVKYGKPYRLINLNKEQLDSCNWAITIN